MPWVERFIYRDALKLKDKIVKSEFPLWLTASIFFLIPPLIFLLVIHTGMDGGYRLLDLWDLLPSSLLRLFIVILPLPALVFSIISFTIYYRSKQLSQLILSSITGLISITAIVITCLIAFQIP